MTGSFDSLWTLGPQSTVSYLHSVSLLLTPRDTRIMSLAERAPVNSALPLGFLAVPDFAPAELNTPDSPRSFLLQEAFPNLQIPDLTLSELGDPGAYQGGLFHCPACSVPLKLQGVSASV